MRFTLPSATVVAAAALALWGGSAGATDFSIAEKVQALHPEAFSKFQTAKLVNPDGSTASFRMRSRRQKVPVDAQPDPNRPVVTPENIFVLQCPLAGFHGVCTVYASAPGDCANYASYNSSQAFLDTHDNQTSSLSTNTGGVCQFYKFPDCNNKGDDRGVTLDYNYNLAEPIPGEYSGDYDKQISSWRC